MMLLTIACSTSARRDDGAAMHPPTHGSPGGSTAAPAAQVHLATPQGEVAVAVEVVATDAKIQRGLMYRQHLPPDSGMLFLMGREHDWSFWMRNTLIPLDMIFIGADMSIVGIVENARPRTETLRNVGKPSLYVLEVNGGWTKSRGVVPGAKVRFENVPGA
jgi:uncharacterized protein